MRRERHRVERGLSHVEIRVEEGPRERAAEGRVTRGREGREHEREEACILFVREGVELLAREQASITRAPRPRWPGAPARTRRAGSGAQPG